MYQALFNRSFSLIISAVLILSVLQIVFASSAHALPSHWLDPSANPTLQGGWTIDSTTYADTNKKPHEECTQRTYVTRPARSGQSQQTVNGCWYRTSMGMIYDKYVVGNGQSIAGEVTDRTNTTNVSNMFHPTARENILLDRYYNGANGSYKFRYNPALTATPRTNGSLAYSITYSDTFTIGFQNSSSLSGYEITYSNNGKYAMFSRNTALARVNLDTKQILTYGAPSGWYSGNPMDSTATVTEDGAYAIVTAGRASHVRWMRVFDLNDCTDSSEYSYITASSTASKCAHRNFNTFIQSSIPSFNYYTAGEFSGNDTITFYHRNGTSSPYTYTQYNMSIESSGGTKYFALGDSLSAGEGAFNYVYPTHETDPKNLCHTSSKSYPYLINDALSLGGFASFACSGATIPNIVGANGVRQDFATDPYSDNQWWHDDYKTTHWWSPGFDNQLSKVKKEKPDILTMSIGINDIGFENKIRSCLTGTPCFNSYEDRKELANEIKGIFTKSVNTYKQLKRAAAPGAKIFVTGYPQIAHPSSAASCGVNVILDSDERQFLNDATDYLNSVVEAAADKAGVYYVDISNSLSGYRLCEGATGSVAVNGLTKGDDFSHGVSTLWQEVFGRESMHPNKLGHQLMRNAIISQTSSFTQAMPAPDSSVTAPAATDTIPLLANVPKNNRTVRSTVYAHGIVNNIVAKTSNLVATVKGSELGTRSGSAFTVELHSMPTSLGTFTSNDNGDIDISAAIPSTVDPGYHTLHIFGKNTDGVDVDIYKEIYVAETEEDWDGDEILNEEDECVMIEPSGIDEDEDGIDDTCDPVIGELIDLDEEEELAAAHSTDRLYQPIVNSRTASIDYKPEEYLIS